MAEIRILMLEDNELDLELIKEELKANQFKFISKTVFKKTDFISALKDFNPDLILSDYNLPQFTGFDALELAIQLAPNIPFILVTGHLSEELAADAIKSGAWDYVLKTNLLRLVPAIENAFKLKTEKDYNERNKKDLVKLLTAVEQSSNSIIITDVDGNIEFTNTKFSEISGYTATEVLGKNAKILNSQFHSSQFFDELWETISSGKTWSGEFKNKTKNGDLFWEQATITPIKDSDGTIVNYLAVKEDITKRRKAENDLRESYRVINSSPVVVFSWGFEKEWDAEFVSKNVFDLLGYSVEEFLTNKVSYKDIIHPEDFNKVYGEVLTHHNLNKKDKLIQEYRVITKNGTIKWVRDFPLVRTDANNQITHFHGVIQDITEIKKNQLILKESENNLLEAQRIAKVGSYNLDLKTNTSKTSITFKTIIGFDVNKELSFEDWRTITHPEDSPNNQKLLEKCINTGETFDAVYRILTYNNKELKWIHGIGEIIYKDDEPISFVGTIQDITAQKKAEIDLQNAYHQVEALKKQLETENVYLKEEIALSFNYENLIYSSEAISNVLTQVEQVSNTNATVLILGETGTGKELIAKAIHNTSNRKNGSLIRVNCAAIPAELLESELFGHTKGSFTGAIKDRIGKFQLANGGTLFLDEIGEMPMELQPKLLRAIQEGEIEPIGSSKTIKLDLRIIAATNRQLKKEVEAKRFRQDLYFRLNVFPITIPPLRDRIEDIPVLVDYFLDKYGIKYQKNISSIPKSTLQQMKVYPWPGNVRELENIVERAVITANNDRIVFSEFESKTQDKPEINGNSSTSLDEIQTNHIIKTLNQTKWKISGKDGAAALLNMKVSTLRDRIAKLGINKSNHL